MSRVYVGKTLARFQNCYVGHGESQSSSSTRDVAHWDNATLNRTFTQNLLSQTLLFPVKTERLGKELR
jgi:hypothetical protein